jgi:hypothetical protein
MRVPFGRSASAVTPRTARLVRNGVAFVGIQLPGNAPAILTYSGLTSCKVAASRIEVAYETISIRHIEGDWKYVERWELGAATPSNDIDGRLNYFFSQRGEREPGPYSQDSGAINHKTGKPLNLTLRVFRRARKSPKSLSIESVQRA